MLTLLLDIGGTVLKRSKPGPKQRVINALSEFYNLSESIKLQIADIVLTSSNPDQAVCGLRQALDIEEHHLDLVTEALMEAEGSASVLPGAIELIETATSIGSNIFFVTNAVAWAPSLPRSLQRFKSSYISSSALGLSKRNPEFWRSILKQHALDSSKCLSVGDSEMNDIFTAQRCGIAAWQVQKGHNSLAHLSKKLATVGAAPRDDSKLVLGNAIQWGGQRIVEAPHLASMTSRATRVDVEFVSGALRTRSQLVRRSNQQSPVLIIGDYDDEFVMGWVSTVDDRRLSKIPKALSQRLQNHGVDLLSLPQHYRRHFSSLLLEASTEEVFEARLQALLKTLEPRTAVQQSEIDDKR